MQIFQIVIQGKLAGIPQIAHNLLEGNSLPGILHKISDNVVKIL